MFGHRPLEAISFTRFYCMSMVSIKIPNKTERTPTSNTNVLKYRKTKQTRILGFLIQWTIHELGLCSRSLSKPMPDNTYNYEE